MFNWWYRRNHITPSPDERRRAPDLTGSLRPVGNATPTARDTMAFTTHVIKGKPHTILTENDLKSLGYDEHIERKNEIGKRKTMGLTPEKTFVRGEERIYLTEKDFQNAENLNKRFIESQIKEREAKQLAKEMKEAFEKKEKQIKRIKLKSYGFVSKRT